MSAERGSISAATSHSLWVTAGGRCEYRGCNQYLLVDDLTGYELNLAERAHIVGAIDAPGSPRGDAPLERARRGDAENLILLCRRHHRVIDGLVGEHSVTELRQMKREHEDRIHLLTGLDEEHGTVVVRAIGAIRGAPVEIPPETVLAAVRAEGRFPRFPLAMAGEDLEIDLRTLPGEGDPDYFAIAERVIVERVARIRDAQGPIGHLSVFALARIPLLVALGYHLDDKIPTTIYSRRRTGTAAGDWGFTSDADPVRFQAGRRGGRPGTDRVAIAISVTAPIGGDVDTAATEAAIYEIAPRGRPPGRDLLASRASLASFASTYHGLLARIEADHPRCEAIDLYAAVPVGGAVELGRGVMRDSQPTLRVHDRDADGDFCLALTLGRADARSRPGPDPVRGS